MLNEKQVNHLAAVFSAISSSECGKYNSTTLIETKQDGSKVTGIDIEIQKAFIEEINKHFPGSTIIAEEDTCTESLLDDDVDIPQGTTWIIDPLDGTGNFLRGGNDYRSSVALLINQKSIASWIHDPSKKQTMCALKGDGVWVHQTNKPVKYGNKSKNYIETSSRLEKAFQENYSIFHSYSKSASYQAIINGLTLGAVFTGTAKIWDHVPGILMLSELGGITKGISGEVFTKKCQEKTTIIMANSKNTWNMLRQHLTL